MPGDSQRTRETPGPSGSGAGRPGLAGFLALTLALASLEAAAQTVTGLTATPGGFSAFPSMAPGTAWPTVGSAIPALWTPSGPVTAPGPAGPILPPFLVTGAIAAAQGYNTNVTQTSTGAAKGDTFTQGQLDLGIHYHSLKLKLDAHSSTNAYYFYNEHDANQFNQNLNLTANSELIPNHLFLNLNAYAAPVTLSRVGQISATPGLQVRVEYSTKLRVFRKSRLQNPLRRLRHVADIIQRESAFLQPADHGEHRSNRSGCAPRKQLHIVHNIAGIFEWPIFRTAQMECDCSLFQGRPDRPVSAGNARHPQWRICSQ